MYCTSFHILRPFLIIQLTLQTFTHALYHLAANPELLEPLRQEVEIVTNADGWTKAAMGKMRKLDSLLRESQRINGISAGKLKTMNVIASF